MSDTDDLVKLSFFTNIGKAIASATSLEETLREVMDQIGKIFAPSYWSLLLRNPSTGELTFRIVIGSGVEALQGRKLPKGTGIAGWIAESGQDVIIEDVSRDSRFDSSMDELTDFTTKSIIGVPLKSRNRVFGVIELINKLDGTSFSPLELNLLKTIADFAAIAIEKAYYVRALKRVASVDPLTGLYNRRSFRRFLEREIERSKRSKAPFTLMMVDVDGFKAINDTYGHVAGDNILKELASVLQSTTRKADLVCRYGGDEFIVIMPNLRMSEAERVRDRITRNIGERNREASIRIAATFGLHESDGVDTDDVVQFVDEELYRKKQERVEQNIENIDENLSDFLRQESGDTDSDDSDSSDDRPG